MVVDQKEKSLSAHIFGQKRIDRKEIFNSERDTLFRTFSFAKAYKFKILSNSDGKLFCPKFVRTLSVDTSTIDGLNEPDVPINMLNGYSYNVSRL